MAEAMADPIRVDVSDDDEGIDLIEALAVRGLSSGLVRGGRHPEVEISYAHEDTERLLADVTAALETWLADRHRDSISLRVADRVLTVEPHEELAGASSTSLDG